MLLQAVLVGLALHLSGSIQRRLQTAELLQQLNSAFVADARRTWDVIHRVAQQSEQVGDERRGDAFCLLDLGGIVDDVILHHVEHGDTLIDKLQHVLVAGHNHGLVSGLGGQPGNGSDHIVRLVAVHFEDGDSQRRQQPQHHWDLLDQFGRSLAAIGFVLVEHRVAECRQFALKHSREQIRIELSFELPNHVVEDVDRFS